MSLKAQLPTFEKGSPDLGGQLRELLAVVVKLCEAIEGQPPVDVPVNETPQEAPETPAETAEAPEAPAKAAAKPAAKAAAAK